VGIETPAVAICPGLSSGDLIASEELPLGKGEVTTMNHDHNLDEILESAVVANWPDLMRGDQRGLIHLEYDFVPSGALKYLQVWSSVTRGYWFLACAYDISTSELRDTGVHFHNGYHSEGLAHILERVIASPGVFALFPHPGRAGLLQIATPTRNERAAAAVSMSEAFDLLNSLEPALA
jgi:hypothetical protein